MLNLIDRLQNERILSKDEFVYLLNNITNESSQYLFEKARNLSTKYFGKRIYTRGLIEFTSFCKNDCYYCGLRKSNKNAERYRLNKEEILNCCEQGYELGFRTFVLQGGEDLKYSADIMTDIVATIRKNYEDCAITLSIGEKSYDEYKKLFDAGANRYLLRHETITEEHYRNLHPEGLSLSNRKKCLYNLKEIGYQVGTGFMVGSPFQTINNIVDDLLFIKEFKPEMIGIGPFISHKDTPFKDYKSGSCDLTLILLAIIRLMLPNSLIPATTALGTIDKNGRELGIMAGANVVMPNLSPVGVRKKYLLYDNKICTGEESAEGLERLKKRIEKIGYDLVSERGDFCPIEW